MYIRQSFKTVKGKKYDQFHLIQAIRTPKGPRQKLILNLGTIDIQKDDWKSLADCIESKLYNTFQKSFIPIPQYILDMADHYVSILLSNKLNSENVEETKDNSHDFVTVDLNSTSLSNSKTIGSEHIVNSQFKKYNIDKVLSNCQFSLKEISYSKLLIASKLIHPASERETVRWLCEASSFAELNNFHEKIYDNALHKVATKLWKHKDEIEDMLSKKSVELFDLKENIILYDLTNTFFESDKRSSEIAKYGRSKEKRSDAPLVSLAMTVDEDGFPKNSRLFKGNVSEPETLKIILKKLNKDDLSFPNHRTIVIDAGIATEENLNLIKDNNFSYIAVSRKRNYDESLWDFAEEKRIILSDGKTDLRIKRAEQSGEVFLLCISKNKEKKELAMQTRRTQHFEKALLDMNSKLHKPNSNKKYEKILERIGRLKERYQMGNLFKITIKKDKNEIVSKIEFQQIKKFKTPGEYVIRTNRTGLTDEEISKLHRSLTRIESGFRSLKQETGLRPNYHKSDSMMKAHILLSIIAYHFVAGIIKQLRDANIKLSWNTVRNIMSTHTRVTTKMVTKENTVVTLRSNTIPTMKQAQLYNALKINHYPLSMRKYDTRKCSDDKK
jgi:transposase